MRRFIVYLVLFGLAACSAAGSSDCPTNSAFCAPDCTAPSGSCAGVDGGASDAGRGDASLLSLSVSPGTLSPTFASGTTLYKVAVSSGVTAMQVTASARDPSATLQVNGEMLASGVPSSAIPLGAMTTILVKVQVRGGSMQGYTLVVRQSQGDPTYLKASNTDANDAFGFSVSLAGDTLAVGAINESSKATGINGDQTDNSAQNAGAVYIFRSTGASYTQEAYVKASNADGGDFFGSSVSLSGDTLAVGAINESSKATGINGDQTNNSLPLSGAVYVFQRTGTSWAQQAYIKASNTDSGDAFGCSVSLSGDTLAVGAAGESSKATGINGDQADNSASYSGAAYVFQRTGTSWAQQAYTKASNARTSSDFGFVVSLSVDTLAVGAPFESSKATGINGDQTDHSAMTAGAAYVFQRTGTNWAQQAYIKASNTDAGDLFGTCVSLSGDTLAVGAPVESSSATGVGGNQADNGAPRSGAAYVFQRTGTSWTEQAYIKASNTDAGDNFGSSVSLSGEALVIGASSESSAATGVGGDQVDNSAPRSGAVYLFQRTGTSWAQQAYLKASNTGAGDQFGIKVSLSGMTLVAGARGESSQAMGVGGDPTDNSATESGAVYVFK